MLKLTLVLLLAAAPLQGGANSKFLGWSADGTALVWTEQRRSVNPEQLYFRVTDGGERQWVEQKALAKMSDAAFAQLGRETGDGFVLDSEVTLAVVHVLATGAQTRYRLAARALTREGKRDLPDPAVVKQEASAFAEWKAKNLSVQQGPSGPRGAEARMLYAGQPATKVDTPSCYEGTEQQIAFSVSRGPDRVSQSIDPECQNAIKPRKGTLAAWWDPTGRRVAFTYTVDEAEAMRGPISGVTKIVVLEIPPRVEVLAPARLDAEAKRTATLVESIGVPVSSVGPATKDRETTVIYARKGDEELARALSKALPGSAIEPLTWKANAELVIAVGAPK